MNTAMKEFGSQTHNRVGLLGPNSIVVTYVYIYIHTHIVFISIIYICGDPLGLD